MISPTGIIPEELMHAAMKREVKALIVALPLIAADKRELLLGWAVSLRTTLNQFDYAEVEASGTDAPSK